MPIIIVSEGARRSVRAGGGGAWQSAKFGFCGYGSFCRRTRRDPQELRAKPGGPSSGWRQKPLIPLGIHRGQNACTSGAVWAAQAYRSLPGSGSPRCSSSGYCRPRTAAAPIRLLGGRPGGPEMRRAHGTGPSAPMDAGWTAAPGGQIHLRRARTGQCGYEGAAA